MLHGVHCICKFGKVDCDLLMHHAPLLHRAVHVTAEDSSPPAADSHKSEQVDKQPERFALSAHYIADYLASRFANVWSSQSTKPVGSASTKAPSVSSKTLTAGVETKPRKAQTPPPVVTKPLLSRESIDARTRALTRKLRLASSAMSKLLRVEELNLQLLLHPDSRGEAVKEKVVPTLLRLRHKCNDPALEMKVNESLALVGYVPPVRGRGISILSIDGGGTRGLMALEVLECLEAQCGGQKIHELFDYVVGVSTGAIIAALLTVTKFAVGQCKDIYIKIAADLFNQSRVWGASGLLRSHSYYDTALWVSLLRQVMGEKTMIETAGDRNTPKLGFISTVVNQPRMEAFVFRNYNLPHWQHSMYRASSAYRVWEALQASGAAPGYFQECRLDNFVHQDGGVLVNNATAIGLHECRMLWPDRPVQCVVSIGNGRSVPIVHQVPTSIAFSSLRDKVLKIIDSATDTEGVHTVLHDLLDPAVYFRMNPYMSEVCTLDENRPTKLRQLQQDAQLYCRKNEPKLVAAAERLTKRKSPIHQALDLAKHQYQLYM